MYEDPEWARYQRKYPRFPGVEHCVKLLGGTRLRGTGIEFIMLQLEDHSSEHVTELISAIHTTEDDRVRALLVSALSKGDASGPEVLTLFEHMLWSDYSCTWSYATHGLRRLNTKDARRVLWRASQRKVDVNQG